MPSVIDPELTDVLRDIGRHVPPWPDDPDVEDRRAALEAVYTQLRREPVARVADLNVPGDGCAVPVRIYSPADARPVGALVFCHGGAWLAGSIESHDGMCRVLANRSGAAVVNVGYRLAPEHPFPAGVDDVDTVVGWAADHLDELGGHGGLAIGGDSAGATLSAVAAISARDRGDDRIALQVLVYPATDMRMTSATWSEFGADSVLRREEVEWSFEQYGSPDVLDWRVSPLLADDHGGLAPALVITAECDPLRDEAEQYGTCLRAAGVAVTVERYQGMVHGFVGLAGLAASERALAQVAGAVRSAVRSEQTDSA
jgi:acetyl esterase